MDSKKTLLTFASALFALPLVSAQSFFGQVWDFRTIAMQWSSIGMFDIILPMILIFVVVYAVLQRTKILLGRKEIDAIVALIISFFVIGNPEVSGFFLPLFSNLALGIIVIVAFLLIMGLISGRPGKQWPNITLWGGIIIFIWIMSRAADYFSGYNLIFSSTWWYSNSYWVIPVILILIVVGVVASTPNTKEEEKKINMIEWPFAKHYEDK